MKRWLSLDLLPPPPRVNFSSHTKQPIYCLWQSSRFEIIQDIPFIRTLPDKPQRKWGIDATTHAGIARSSHSSGYNITACSCPTLSQLLSLLAAIFPYADKLTPQYNVKLLITAVTGPIRPSISSLGCAAGRRRAAALGPGQARSAVVPPGRVPRRPQQGPRRGLRAGEGACPQLGRRHTALHSASWHPSHAKLSSRPFSSGANAPPQSRTSVALILVPFDITRLHSYLLIYRAAVGRRTADDQWDASLPAQIPFSLCLCRKR